MIVADTLFGRLMTLHFEITGTRLTVGRLWSPYNRIHSAGHRGECVQLHCNVSSVVYICSLEPAAWLWKGRWGKQKRVAGKKVALSTLPALDTPARMCIQMFTNTKYKYTQMFRNTKYIYANVHKYQVHIHKYSQIPSTYTQMFTNTKYIYN